MRLETVILKKNATNQLTFQPEVILYAHYVCLAHAAVNVCGMFIQGNIKVYMKVLGIDEGKKFLSVQQHKIPQ